MKAQEYPPGPKARLYTVFFGFPKEGAEQILQDLEQRFEGIEFVGRQNVYYPGKDALDYAMQRVPDAYASDEHSNAVLREIEESKANLDGLLLFFGGFCDRRYFLSGLPMLLVDYNAFPSLQIGFKNAVGLAKRYGAKFLKASLSTTDLSDSVAEARTADFASKLELFQVLARLKHTRIMDVQVKGFGAEPHEHWWRLEAELYLHTLQEVLGLDLRVVDYRDLFKVYAQVTPDEAESLARQWLEGQSETNSIRNTRNVGGVTDEEVVNAVRLYLATDKLRKEYGCNAVTLDATTWADKKELAASLGEQYLVSGSLALTEFRLHGIPSCCQSDVESLVTLALGEALAHRPGLHGDLTLDPFNEVTQVCHCNAPLNPFGDDYRAPYSIGGEPIRRPQVYVDLPQEGVVTIKKLNVLNRQLSLWTGELVPGESIYRNFFESCCCTKLIAKTNAKAIYENYDYRTFGNHNCLFYGDYREQLKQLATLLGLEVIEQDK